MHVIYLSGRDQNLQQKKIFIAVFEKVQRQHVWREEEGCWRLD